MAVTPEHIDTLFTEMDIQAAREQENLWAFSFATEHYHTPAGQPHVKLHLRLDSEGEYLNLYVHHAFVASGPHRGAFFEAAARVGWQRRLVRFMYDDEDGEVRLAVELPVCDGVLTEAQLHSAINCVMGTLEEYYPTLKRALDVGVIAMPDDKEETPMLDRLRELHAILDNQPGRMAALRAKAVGEALQLLGGQGETVPSATVQEPDGPPTRW